MKYLYVYGEDISRYTTTYDPICPITGVTKKLIKGGRTKHPYYRFFDSAVYEYFENNFINTNDTTRITAFKFKCYLNLLYNKEYGLWNINSNIIDSKYIYFIPTRYEYFLRKNNYNEVLAKELYKNRQSTTSKENFIKRFGNKEGLKKYQTHFDNIHKQTSASNHWTKNLNCTFKEYLMKLYDTTEEKLNDIISGRQRLIDLGYNEQDISLWFSNKVKKGLKPKTDDQLKRWRESLKRYIEESKNNGSFYKTFGCWKVCYQYSLDNDIEYTDINRKNIYNLIFSPSHYTFWLNKGFTYEESIKKANQYLKPTSKQSIYCFLELEKKLSIEIIKEYPIDNFFVDGYNIENNLIIEYFGDYWHMNPEIYKDPELMIRGGKTAKEIWLYDQFRLKTFDDLGYNSIIIWESKWKADKNYYIEKIKSLIK